MYSVEWQVTPRFRVTSTPRPGFGVAYEWSSGGVTRHLQQVALAGAWPVTSIEECGDPGGIRTRDLDLERVASWARLDDGVGGRQYT